MLFPLIPFVAPAAPPRPELLAHYMPWYENKVVSGKWGWHWTMNKFDPDQLANGRHDAASQFRPLIGLYDSNDPQAVDCHVLLMKFAGIDGVLVDWYGNVETYDYASNHRNTERMFTTAKRAGLKFGLVYEDQTVPQLIKNGKFKPEEAVAEGQKLMRWVARNWFSSPTYLKDDGRPLFLVFGPQYYPAEAWKQMFEGLPTPPAFYTLHHRKEPAIGAYDWPLPQGGTGPAREKRERFYAARKEVPNSIPVAYPRFHDIYKTAGVQDSFDIVEDLEGKTYETSLTEALTSGAKFVQIATWNDWGEGTQIEPSEEFGYRDLETTQRLRKSRYVPADLRLPVRLYLLQKRHAGDLTMQKKLAAISTRLFKGDLASARMLLKTDFSDR